MSGPRAVSLPPLPAAHLRKHPLRELLFSSLVLLALAAGVQCAVRVQSIPAAMMLSTALGLLSVQMVLILHDCMHASLFHQNAAHVWLGRIIGAYFFSPYSFLRMSHLEHHRAAGLVDGDPEVLDFTEAHAMRSPARSKLVSIARSPFAALLFAPGVQAVHFFEWLAAERQGESRTGLLRATALDLLCMAALWIPICLWAQAHGALLRVLLIALLAPFLIGLTLTTLATLPLHTLTAGYRLDALPMRDRSFFVARTIDSNPIVRGLFFNLSYHLEHHLYPSVSRWALGPLARQLRPTLLAESEAARLPLLIHPGYLRWYAEHMSRRERFNPALDRESFNQANRRFRGVLLRDEEPHRPAHETVAPAASEMTASRP
jgi:omega-6 fatty acid desaturase (delta-12 desaturase)